MYICIHVYASEYFDQQPVHVCVCVRARACVFYKYRITCAREIVVADT
jgi:hypothetical protein